MWFRKNSKGTPPPSVHAGSVRAADGRSAILDVAAAACDAIGVGPADGVGPFEPAFSASMRRLDDAGSLYGWAAGHAAAGRRVAALTGGLPVAAGPALPLVIHATAPADGGLFHLAARNVQEAADFALIAHRIAELALQPGLCLCDAETARSVQTHRPPTENLVRSYLGRPGDTIESSTAAQQLLFGKTRRRIPTLFDPDRAAGIGAVHERDSRFRALAAERTYLVGGVAELADRAMREFAALTARNYARVSTLHADDAEIVVVAQGSVVEDLESVAAHLRETEKLRIGVVNVSLMRPFPADLVARALKGKRAATVLDRSEALLFREVRCAVEGVPLHSGICDAPSPSELIAVFRNMLPAGAGRKFFFLGARFSDPGTRLPKIEVLQQVLKRAYPEVEAMSLTAAEESLPPRPAIEIRFPSGGSGTFASGLLSRAFAEALGGGVRTTCDEADTMQPAVFRIVRGEGAASGPAAALLASSPSLVHADVVPGGLILVESDLEPEALWLGFHRELRRRIAERKPKLIAVPSRKIVSEIPPQYADDLAIFALLGAFVGRDSAAGKIRDAMKKDLEARFGAAHPIVADILRTMERGAKESREVEFSAKDGPPVAEPETPWTVKEAKRPDGTVFDPARFWDSAGFFYESGRIENTFADPFTATGILPARSSAAHDAGLGRYRLPRLIAERCTGCGLCWTLCPDSALPPALQSFSSLIGAATRAAGDSLLQMQRIQENLAKVAHRLFAKDELRRYLAAGPLLKDAFKELVEKTGLAGDALRKTQAEFDLVAVRLEHFPLVRTKAFFDDAEAMEKGAGRALAIALNPLACKGCLQCVEVCPDKALESVPQTAEVLDRARAAWELLPRLPDPPGDFGPRFQFFHRKTYHALVGGDGSFPGCGAKTALHLAASTIESMMRPRVCAHVARLTDLIDRLQKRIQERVAQQVKINDFESFGRKLGKIRNPRLDLDALAELMGDEPEAPIDRGALERLSRSLEELKEQRERFLSGLTGDGRARLGMAVGAGFEWIGTFPYNPCGFPWVAGGDAVATAEGLIEGVTAGAAGDFHALLRAECELEGAPAPARRPLAPEEAALVPPVVVLLHDRHANADAISRGLRNGRKILVIDTLECDPRLSDEVPPREFGLLGLMHPEAFVLQSTIGEPDHLLAGLRDGMARSGPALFHIYAPDPQRHGMASGKAIEQARLAVRARVFPVFRFDSELSLDGNPPEDGATFADWAVREARFRGHFRRISKSAEEGVLLGDARYLVSPEIVAAGERRLRSWKLLQQLARKEKPAAPAGKPASDEALQERLAQNLMAMCGMSGEEGRMSVREFVERVRRGG